jgi:asparagine synthase (glutamine-hydrolysing)
MSIFIGYWSSASNRSRDELKQVLVASVSPLSSPDLRIGFAGCSSEHEHRREATTNFGIAVSGRHTNLKQSRPGDETNQTLTATLSAGGARFAPDAWAKVTPDELRLGRDIFGRGTIFWTATKSAVWFSSRLEFLLRVAKHPQLSIRGFSSYGSFSYVPAPHTPIEEIFAIPAGKEMIWRAPEVAPESHLLHQWRESEEQSRDEQRELRALRRLLEESVNEQFASSHEPVGVFLSGGLDSSVTAALLAHAGAKLRAFTLDLQGDCSSEIGYAELVARKLGIPLTKVAVTASSMRRALSSTAKRLDGLYGDGVTVPLALLYQRASEEVQVVFNGEGGDQLFAGWTNKPLIAASIYEAAPNPDAAAQMTDETFVSQYMRTFHRFYGHETNVYTTRAQRAIDSGDWQSVLAHALDPAFTNSLMHRLRRANLLLKGADNIQPRATNLGLSYNLDVRTLFCSRPLAEWTFGTSGDLWLRGGCEKYLLKRAVEDLLPPEVVWREKRGMGVPLTQWLNGPLRRWVRRQLHPRVLASEGLWEPDLAERIANAEFSGHVQGRRIGEMLWLMLMWRAWGDHFVKLHAPAARQRSIANWRFTFPFTSLTRRTSS